MQALRTSMTLDTAAVMDCLVRALAFDDTLRVITVVSTNTVQTAMELHKTAPTASVAFGRLLTGALLLGATNKGNERFTLQLDGGGPFGMLLARTITPGEVYGTIKNPGIPVSQHPDGRLNVGAGVGTDGQLMVIRDLGMREPYVGTTPLLSGEIGDELTFYLSTSEQIQSAVGLGVNVSSDARCIGAGGFLIQVLGDVPDARLAEVEAKLAELRTLSKDIEDGLDAEALLERLTGGDHRIMQRVPVAWNCPLDRAYYLERLSGLGAQALNEAFGDDPSIEVICEMSRIHHVFTREDFSDVWN